jgi:ApaG protein
MDKLATLTTKGIKVSVENSYQEDYSRPFENKYIFAYRITIINNSPYTVQLMRRHWTIFDSNGMTRIVEGEGVIGQQPILEPGASHQYISWSHLFTDMGRMKGFYTFQRNVDGASLEVIIPEFELTAPFKLN